MARSRQLRRQQMEAAQALAGQFDQHTNAPLPQQQQQPKPSAPVSTRSSGPESTRSSGPESIQQPSAPASSQSAGPVSAEAPRVDFTEDRWRHIRKSIHWGY